MIDGLDTLLAALHDLEGLDPTEALQACGDVLLDGAQQRVRVDTGELHDSLRVVVKQDAALLETDSDHAEANEFGTRQMPAQSFLRVTVDEDGGQAIEALAKVLAHQIEQVGR